MNDDTGGGGGRQRRAGQRRAGQQRPGQQRPGQQRPGQQRPGQQRAGLRRAGLRRAGLRRAGLRRAGLRRAGLRRAGLRRAGLRRAGGRAAALAGIALLVAACGGGGSSTVTGSTPYQKTLAYAQCMRSHGEPGFPDPTSQGLFPHIPAPSPQYLSANKACGHLLPTYTVTPAQRQQDFSRALKFSACMRSHGILSYRDPVEQPNGNIELGGNPGPGSSPQMQAAWQACRQFGPGGGS